MADFTALKTAITNAIKQNGNQAITGNLLQEILIAMVESMGDTALNDLATSIQTSLNSLSAVDGNLENAISSEVSTRQSADNSLSSAINSEALTRSQADATLQQNVNIESNQRQSTDNSLQNQITVEKNARIDAVNRLQGLIDAINNVVGKGYTFGGVVKINDAPQQGKMFYIALERGNYINFGGASVHNGITLIYKNGQWIAKELLDLDVFYGEILRIVNAYQPIVIEGNVTNAPDEEDLTSNNVGLLQFKNKAFAPTIYSGLGRKYLRKNIRPMTNSASFDGFVENVESEASLSVTPDAIFWDRINERFVGKKDDVYYQDWTDSDDYVPVSSELVYMNEGTPYRWDGTDLIVYDEIYPDLINMLTQEMISDANTIYHIQYDYILGEDITVPANCVLEFDGGSISGGTVTLTNIGIKGTYHGNNVQYSGSIRIDTAVRLKDFNLIGSININTTEHVVLENCIINAVSGTNGAINLPANSNVTLKDCELYTEDNTYYGIVSSYKVASLVVENCKIHGFYRAGIFTVYAVSNSRISNNEIYDIGNFATTGWIGAYGIKMGTNVPSPFADYDNNTIIITGNYIHDIYTAYLTGNDETECHGILLYSHNVVITNNKVENLLGGTSVENLSIFGGTEHEGIYVKGFNPYIVGNKLINACGNISCDGAISHKWFGVGGVFVDNYIEQYFGHGIYSQSSGLVITGNTIIIKDPVDINTESKPIERHACIYANTVDYNDPDQKDCPSQIVNNIISNYSTIDNEYPTIYCQTAITSYNVSDNTVVSKDIGGFFRINHYPKNNADIDLVNNVSLNISDNIVDIKGSGGSSYIVTIFSQTYGSLTDYTLLDIIFNNNKITTNTQNTGTFFLNRSEYAKNLSFINNNIKGEQLINFISSLKFGEVTMEGNNISNHIKYLFYILTTEASTNFIVKDNIIKGLEYMLYFVGDTTRQLNTIAVLDNIISYDYTYLVRGQSTTNKIIDGVNLYVLGNKKINYLSNGITWNLNTFSKSVISDVFKNTIGLKNIPVGFDNEQDGRIVWWNGTRYVDGEGVRADALHSGTWANKPSTSEVPVGFQYFCTNKPSSPGSPIYNTGEGWVYADGTAVS